jgi:hypothetical protein
MENQQPATQKPRQIQIRDNFAGGEYANMMQVSHNKEEFLLIFANVVAPTGRVVGKIITSPGHLKRMITALSENLKKYEDKFGAVEEAESPRNEIGFKSQ